MKKTINLREQAVWMILVCLIVVFSLAVPNFFSFGNGVTILRQISNIGILSCGMAFALICGGIDLSNGNLMGLVGVAVALFMTTFGLNPVVACILGIVIGLIIGFLNGFLITYTRMPPLIMTLGMSYVVRGLAYIINGGYPVYGLPDSIRILGQGYIFGVVPVCVLIAAATIFIGAFILNSTYLGRQIYALGCNEEATRLSGLNVNRIRILAYTISGVLAAISGIVMMSRVNSGQPLSGKDMDMDALIACVVGGISPSGGEGKPAGIIGGMLVMGVLANGMAVAGLSEYLQMVVKGAVLISVVAVDSYSKTHIKKPKIHTA